ncbi:MAG TPA: GHKL domain-containing protein [Candidatus Paceibacterota bacterium]
MLFSMICFFISNIIITTNLYNIKLVQLTYKDLIIFNVINIVIPLIVIFTNEAFGIPGIFVLFLLYLYSKNKKIVLNMMAIIMSILIFSVIDMICGYLFIKIFNISIHQLMDNKKIYILLYITVFILSFIASKLIGLLIGKSDISKYLKQTNNKLTLLIITNIMTAGITIYILAMINKFLNTSNFVVILNIVLFIIYFISTISLTLFYGKYVKREVDYKHRQQEFEQLKEYTDMLEYTQNEMRKFKHDYINIISTVDGYIEEGSMKSLKTYFNKNIIPLSENINIKNSNIGLLQHIKVTGLKGLLSSKIVQAQSKEIDTFIDIAEDIEKIDIDVIDLCRIIGILFDNAIEAAVLCSNSKIKFGVIKRRFSVVIVIINSCTNDTPPVYKLFKKGFSTKGINRGLGLSNVKEIVDKKYRNLTLNTTIKNSELIQELEIKDRGERYAEGNCM